MDLTKSSLDVKLANAKMGNRGILPTFGSDGNFMLVLMAICVPDERRTAWYIMELLVLWIGTREL